MPPVATSSSNIASQDPPVASLRHSQQRAGSSFPAGQQIHSHAAVEREATGNWRRPSVANYHGRVIASSGSPTHVCHASRHARVAAGSLARRKLAHTQRDTRTVSFTLFCSSHDRLCSSHWSVLACARLVFNGHALPSISTHPRVHHHTPHTTRARMQAP
jgi:hypothetical protein